MLYVEDLSQDVKKRVRALIAQYEVLSLFMEYRKFRDELESELKLLHLGYDGICALSGTDQFAKINYERKHYSREEIGPRLSVEQIVQYVALRTLQDQPKALPDYPLKPKRLPSYHNLSYYHPLVDVEGELFPEVREGLSESILEQFESYKRYLSDQFDKFKTIELIRALVVQKQVLRRSDAFVITLVDGVLVRQKENRYKELVGTILPFSEEETAKFLAIDSLLMQLHAKKIIGGQDLSLQF